MDGAKVKIRRRTEPHSATTSDATTFETKTEVSSRPLLWQAGLFFNVDHVQPLSSATGKAGHLLQAEVRNLSTEQKSEPSETTSQDQCHTCGQFSGQCEVGDQLPAQMCRNVGAVVHGLDLRGHPLGWQCRGGLRIVQSCGKHKEQRVQ